MRPAMPSYFGLLLTVFLQASPRLTQQVWEAVAAHCSQTVLFQLGCCSTWPTVEQQRHLAALMPPRVLLAATLQRWPEGRLRPREVITLEQMILTRTDRNGAWVW